VSVEGDAAGDRERLFSRRFRARAGELKELRRAVEGALRESGLAGEALHDVVLALDEACQNVIRHAYGGEDRGDIVIDIQREGEGLLFLVRDFAPRIDPSRVRPRRLDDVRPGGLGTHFIRETMDEVVYQPLSEGDGNLLRMHKKIE